LEVFLCLEKKDLLLKKKHVLTTLREIVLELKFSGFLRNWIRMYNANIKLKDYNSRQEVYMAEVRRKTTKEECEEIVEYCLANNCDYKNAAAKFDVSYSQVYNWVKKYDACGVDGLTDKCGHHKGNLWKHQVE
jgi:hypothetical protein